ncbi:hypothetical protein [uncultured Tateyamaria sp.]|uniref:hypothetical protein n=1 Tax=uncultured Tateyamaria sp. TaxID=455651 RepID=UPI002627F0EA|nr:hypothetical protein [uncultured Tateyamaria sp.]
MSYDLMVFNPAVAPRTRTTFLQWYGDITRWEEARDYTDPIGMTGSLISFYHLFRRDFPPLNGPHAVALENVDDPYVTEYSFASDAIYLSFAWSIAELAREATLDAALNTAVGFFDVSETNGAIAYDIHDLVSLKRATQ